MSDDVKKQFYWVIDNGIDDRWSLSVYPAMNEQPISIYASGPEDLMQDIRNKIIVFARLSCGCLSRGLIELAVVKEVAQELREEAQQVRHGY